MTGTADATAGGVARLVSVTPRNAAPGSAGHVGGREVAFVAASAAGVATTHRRGGGAGGLRGCACSVLSPAPPKQSVRPVPGLPRAEPVTEASVAAPRVGLGWRGGPGGDGEPEGRLRRRKVRDLGRAGVLRWRQARVGSARRRSGGGGRGRRAAGAGRRRRAPLAPRRRVA